MPELPEAEAICKAIRKGLPDDPVITDVRIFREPKGGYGLDNLVGHRVTGVHRIGKAIQFDHEDDRGIEWQPRWSALGMSGYWDWSHDPWTFDYVEGKRRSSSSDVRFSLVFGDRELRFHDARLFGTFWYGNGDSRGPEAMATECMHRERRECTTEHLFRQSIHRPGWTVKRFMTDQSVVAGIGNIYSVEGLYNAGVRPDRRCDSLDIHAWAGVLELTRYALRGQVWSDEIDYSRLVVYRRRKCPLFHPVEMVKIDKRSTYFCPTCQR